MTAVWQCCFCSWLCFVLCGLLHLVTSYEVTGHPTGAKLRWLHVLRHPNNPSDHPPCSWFLSLALRADKLLIHISPYKLELTACSSSGLFLTGHTMKINGLLAASLFHFGIDTSPIVLLIQAPKMTTNLLLLSGLVCLELSSNLFLQLHCHLGSTFQSGLIFSSQNPLTMWSLDNHLCI